MLRIAEENTRSLARDFLLVAARAADAASAPYWSSAGLSASVFMMSV
jgi:hypothetical protein